MIMYSEWFRFYSHYSAFAVFAPHNKFPAPRNAIFCYYYYYYDYYSRIAFQACSRGGKKKIIINQHNIYTIPGCVRRIIIFIYVLDARKRIAKWKSPKRRAVFTVRERETLTRRLHTRYNNVSVCIVENLGVKPANALPTFLVKQVGVYEVR